MKKFFLVMTAIVTLSLTSCMNSDNTDSKAKGEALAKQLMELCQQKDTAALLELEQTIRTQEEAIIAAGDSVGIVAFREALKEAREASAPFVTAAKMQQGATKEEAVGSVINDALEGNVDINAVSAAVDAALEKEVQSKKK